MTILFQLNQTTVGVGPQSFNASLSGSFSKVKFTLTRVGWPAGQVGSFKIELPNGSAGPAGSFSGGQAFREDGVTPVNESSLTFYPPNQDATVPTGTYRISINVLQAITTAILVEGL